MERESANPPSDQRNPNGESDAARSVFSAPLNPAELGELLQRIDTLLNAARPAAAPGPDAEIAISARKRLDELRRSRAPFLDLGRGPLRWIASAANLPILPWGRKQRRFNDDLLTIVEQYQANLAETQNTTDLLSDLRARVLRMEQLLREAAGSGGSGDKR